MSAPAPLSQRMQEIIEEWKSDKVCDRSYYINLIEPLVVEVVALEARAQDTGRVLKDICHHVDKDCFATCHGDWSGTSCWTYRLNEALHGRGVGVVGEATG